LSIKGGLSCSSLSSGVARLFVGDNDAVSSGLVGRLVEGASVGSWLGTLVLLCANALGLSVGNSDVSCAGLSVGNSDSSCLVGR